MEYGFFEPVEWPIASAIASVAGLLMVLGQDAGRIAETLADLAIEELRRWLVRLARPWVPCVALLAAPLVVPDSPWLGTLRGLGRLDAEIEMARTDGYYEQLLQSPGERHRNRPSEPPPGWKPFLESGLVDEVADYRRRVLRPNLDAVWNGTTFRTNDLGHRGPSISRGKSPGTFRVVVLGSSNTMGHGVEDEESYARLLERRLAKGRRVEVVNLAVSGEAPTQQLRRLQVDVPALEPDWIVCDITALDLSLEEQHLRWAIARGVEVPFDFVRDALKRSGVDPDDSTEEFHQKFRAHLKPMYDRTIAGWASEAKRIGVPLTAVILPRADSKTESSGLFQLFRETAERHGLRYCDLSADFDRYPLDDYRIGPWDFHPNAFGHRLIFAGLLDGLMADSQFRRTLDGAGHTARK